LDDGVLGAAELGCGDHFHGLGDLLGILDGFYAIANLFELSCHGVPLKWLQK
jgi:hypothetical protein